MAEITKRVTKKCTVEHDISLLKEVMAVGGENLFLQPFTSEMRKTIATDLAKGASEDGRSGWT